MNKENSLRRKKCMYCSNEPTGIIYRPNNEISNVFACTSHATNLFIPFKNSLCDKKQLQQSRYRSPLKASHLQSSSTKQLTPILSDPQPFFDRLMQNIIEEFNRMKKQVMTNYHQMLMLQNNQNALKFTIQGNPSYPYMIINQDEDLMMNNFVNRILNKYNQQKEICRKEQINKRRMEISNALSTKNQTISNKSPFPRDITCLNLSKSIQGSPHRYHHDVQTDVSPALYIGRKNIAYRDYSRTQRLEKK